MRFWRLCSLAVTSALAALMVASYRLATRIIDDMDGTSPW